MKKSLVLVVDDNMENIQVIGGMLKEAGYDIAASTSGADALYFSRKNLPDLVLLDVMMPGMDGYEVCAALRDDIRTRDIPVIFLSALNQTDDIVRGFEAGGVDYVSKPFNQRELLARARTHIELKKARHEIQTLREIIPICAKCKKIRDDQGFWEQVESYIETRSRASFTHSLCPDCARDLYGEILNDEKK
jgi:CheY-like chemotaxis protein